MLKFLCLSLALIATTAAAVDAPPGDAQSGKRLAEANCTQCHIIVRNGPAGWTDAPSFAVIADRPTTTLESLKKFIEQPNRHMLHQPRNPSDAADLAAYILSLKD